MRKTLSVFAVMIALLFAACKKEKNEPQEENDNEEITTVKLTFTNAANAADVVVANWKNLGGDGSAPVIDEINLKANTTYTVTTELFDERKNPADTITHEIEEEADEHRIFHLFFLNANASVADSLSTVATVAPLDKDDNNLPIGLEITVATKGAFTGFLRTVVRHQPGSKDGTYGPGSTDLLAEFPLEIQ